MDGKVLVELHQALIHDLDMIHDRWQKISDMSQQDVNFMVHQLIQNEKRRLGFDDGEPWPAVDKEPKQIMAKCVSCGIVSWHKQTDEGTWICTACCIETPYAIQVKKGKKQGGDSIDNE